MEDLVNTAAKAGLFFGHLRATMLAEAFPFLGVPDNLEFKFKEVQIVSLQQSQT
jgi:hypothetical protein|tara:strand:+ start:86 stop:247 length:162 start_codon:yes stop_codon:yes gene_type:complete